MPLAVGATALGLLVPTTASADATDISGALLSDAQDISAAALSNAAQIVADPNTTCNVKAAGDNAVQRTSVVVGEVYTEDLGSATGECASFDTGTYTAFVTMNLQAYIPVSGVFKWVTFCSANTQANSIEGAAQPVPAEQVCQIVAPSAYLNRYHRVQGVITNTRGQRFLDYSPIWFDNP